VEVRHDRLPTERHHLTDRPRVETERPQGVGVVVVGDLNHVLGDHPRTLPVLVAFTARLEEGETVVDDRGRLDFEVAKEVGGPLVGLVDEVVDDLGVRADAHQRAADHPAGDALDGVLATAEVGVHRAAVSRLERLVAKRVEHATAVVVLLCGDRLERRTHLRVRLGVGPLAEGGVGGVFAVGGDAQHSVGLDGRVRQGHEQHRRPQPLQLHRLGRLDRLAKARTVHALPFERAGYQPTPGGSGRRRSNWVVLFRPAAVVDSMPEPPGIALSPEELRARLRAHAPVTILDVRNRDEAAAWQITGPTVSTIHHPYVDFVQAGVRGTVADLAADLDLAEPVVVICARGEASDRVAGLLRDVGVDARNLTDGMRGWARVYEAAPVTTARLDAGETTVLQYQRPSSGCLAYLVVSEGEAAVIDPLRTFAERYATDANALGARIRYAVDTHVHADHVSGVREVADLTGAAVALPAGARDRGLAFDARLVDDGDTLPVGDATLQAFSAPGHTHEMTAFRLADVLFSGDALFLDSVARPDLEEGDAGAPAAARRLYRTLTERFARLPDETVVAPAHYGDATPVADDGTYTASLGSLRARLAALSMDEEAFVAHVLGDVPPRPANYEEIIDINLGTRSANDEAAFDLELGPNNCAVTAPE
jgi:glyoxylase-like metal-dependent hydrolase (beta-lactamase superfamily II)/rhodanese-related sulfurtransferase